MSKKSVTLVLFLVIWSVLVISLAACTRGGAGSLSAQGTPVPEYPGDFNLTATYGVERLRVQLTAVAGEHIEDQDSSTGGDAGP